MIKKLLSNLIAFTLLFIPVTTAVYAEDSEISGYWVAADDFEGYTAVSTAFAGVSSLAKGTGFKYAWSTNTIDLTTAAYSTSSGHLLTAENSQFSFNTNGGATQANRQLLETVDLSKDGYYILKAVYGVGTGSVNNYIKHNTRFSLGNKAARSKIAFGSEAVSGLSNITGSAAKDPFYPHLITDGSTSKVLTKEIVEADSTVYKPMQVNQQLSNPWTAVLEIKASASGEDVLTLRTYRETDGNSFSSPYVLLEKKITSDEKFDSIGIQEAGSGVTLRVSEISLEALSGDAYSVVSDAIEKNKSGEMSKAYAEKSIKNVMKAASADSIVLNHFTSKLVSEDLWKANDTFQEYATSSGTVFNTVNALNKGVGFVYPWTTNPDDLTSGEYSNSGHKIVAENNQYSWSTEASGTVTPVYRQLPNSIDLSKDGYYFVETVYNLNTSNSGNYASHNGKFMLGNKLNRSVITFGSKAIASLTIADSNINSVYFPQLIVGDLTAPTQEMVEAENSPYKPMKINGAGLNPWKMILVVKASAEGEDVATLMAYRNGEGTAENPYILIEESFNSDEVLDSFGMKDERIYMTLRVQDMSAEGISGKTYESVSNILSKNENAEINKVTADSMLSKILEGYPLSLSYFKAKTISNDVDVWSANEAFNFYGKNDTAFADVNTTGATETGFAFPWTTSSDDLTTGSYTANHKIYAYDTDYSLKLEQQSPGTPAYRALSNSIDLSKDGYYFFKAVYSVGTSGTNRRNHNARFMLGNASDRDYIVMGSEAVAGLSDQTDVAATEPYYPHLITDGSTNKVLTKDIVEASPSVYKAMQINQQQSNPWTFVLVVKASKENSDELTLLTYRESDGYSLSNPYVQINKTIASDEILDSVGINEAGNFTALLASEISVEGVSGEAYKNVSEILEKNKNLELSKPLADAQILEIVSGTALAPAYLKSKTTMPLTSIAKDDFESYTSDSALKEQESLNGGSGWYGPWSKDKNGAAIEAGGSGSHAIVTIDDTTKNAVHSYMLNTGFYREFGDEGFNSVDLSKDGKYFIDITARVNMGAESTNKKLHNLKFTLGNKEADLIAFGTKFDTTKYTAEQSVDALVGFAPRMIINGEESVYEVSNIYPGIFYKYVLMIDSSATEEDKFTFIIYSDFADSTKLISKMEASADLSDKLTYFGASDAQNSTMRILGVNIEKYNDSYGNLDDYNAALNGDLSALLSDSYAYEYLWEQKNAAAGKFSDKIANEVTDISEIEKSLVYTVAYPDNNVDVIMAVYSTQNGVEKLVDVIYASKEILADSRTLYTVGYKCEAQSEYDIFPQNVEGLKVKVFSFVDTLKPYNNAPEVQLSNKAEDAEVLYVSSKATTEGDGSESSPFSDILSAQNYITKNPSATGYRVRIMGGDYYSKNGITFGASSKGTKDAPVIYEAYNGQAVNIIGGIKFELSDMSELSTDDKLYNSIEDGLKDKIKVYDLAMDVSAYKGVSGHSLNYLKNGSILGEEYANCLPSAYSAQSYHSLIFDDEVMTLSRYPDKENGYMTVSEFKEYGTLPKTDGTLAKGFSFTFAGSDKYMQKWQNASDLRIWGYWGVDYSDLSTPASVNAKDGTLVSDYPCGHIGKSADNTRRFIVYNLIEELNSPGEWYIDAETDRLYFYPPENKTSGSLIITGSKNHLINFTKTEHITLKNLNLIGSSYRGINISDCSDITIKNCNLIANGLYAIHASNSLNLKISGCDVSYSGLGGINVSGGSFSNGIESGNEIYSNSVHDLGTIQKTYVPGITFSGYKTKVYGNKLYAMPHQAMSFSGNDNEIYNNEFFNVCNETSDMGAIYVGKSKLNRGNVIRNNYFHDLTTNSLISGGTDINAVYLDDLYDGAVIKDNRFININGTAVVINGGRDNTVTGNTFRNVLTNVKLNPAGINYPTKYQAFIEGIADSSYNKEPYTKYEHLSDVLEDNPYYPKYNIIKSNYTTPTQRDIKLGSGEVDGVALDYDYYINNFNCEIENSIIIQ